METILFYYERFGWDYFWAFVLCGAFLAWSYNMPFRNLVWRPFHIFVGWAIIVAGMIYVLLLTVNNERPIDQIIGWQVVTVIEYVIGFAVAAVILKMLPKPKR